jgi:hypothetical protein
MSKNSFSNLRHKHFSSKGFTVTVIYFESVII